MSSSNSARRSDLLASGAELFLYPNRRKIFFRRIAIIMILEVLLVSFSAGHVVGEGRSALQHPLPNLLAAFGADRGESERTTRRPGEKEACCAPRNTSVELDFTPFVDQLAKAWNGSSLAIVRQLIPVAVQVR